MLTLTQFSIRILVICITFVSIVHATPSVCHTAECHSLGEYYLKNMKKNVPPCKDFYTHVCHGWGNHIRRPRELQFWDVHTNLHRAAMEKLRPILLKRADTTLPIQQARNLYRACLKIPSMGFYDAKVIKKTMSEIGNWPMFFADNEKLPPNFSWSTIDNEYIKRTGKSALFSFGLMMQQDANRTRSAFVEIFTPYATVQRGIPWDKNDRNNQERNHYKAFLMKVIESVAPRDTAPLQKRIQFDLSNVLNFRDLLASISRTGEMQVSLHTIQEMQTRNNRYAGGKQSAKMMWLETVRAIYGGENDADGQPITHATTIAATPDYFVRLANLLKQVPLPIIANHIHLYFAEAHLVRTGVMEKELEKSINLADVPKNKIIYQTTKWRDCIENHNMRDTLAKMYADSYFTEKDKAEVNRLFEEEKMLLQQQIQNSTWVNEDMKTALTQKAAGIRGLFGNPKESSLSRMPSHVTNSDPMAENAFFVPYFEFIYISSSFLQSPLYIPNIPYAIKYASTGALLGHELYHSFGTPGRKFDSKGKLRWPEAMESAYTERMKCFNEPFNQYRHDELKDYKAPDAILPPSLEEDMADVMGLRLAYLGYKKQLERSNGNCQVLPGFETMDCEKLFFIAYGNTFCSASAPGYLENILTKDEHSPPRVRINGAVANMKEFSDAFNCNENDHLNLKDRCNLWEGDTS